MKRTLVYQEETAEVWHADSLDPDHVAAVMGERLADMLCIDAPFSARTHEGHKAGKMTADRAAAFAKRPQKSKGAKRSAEQAYAARKAARGESGRRDLDYRPWTSVDVGRCVRIWAERRAGWFVSITDDVLAPAWRDAFEVWDLHTFPPIPFVETGGRVRFSGDGPSSWTCWVCVARPSSPKFVKWGTLTGYYEQAAERDFNKRGGSKRIVGAKPLKAMGAIVRDYSRAGELVVDPTMGGGTTGIAAKSQGRRFIGIERNLARCKEAAKRIASTGVQVALPWAERADVPKHQVELFEAPEPLTR
jgi:hypothetical protein